MPRRFPALVLAGAALCACHREPPAAGPSWLPPTLQGLAIVDSIGGEAARATLERMHGKGVAPPATRIGVYGDGAPPTVLYVSRYPSPAAAARQQRAMTARIGDGSSGFVPRRVFRAAGVEVHHVAGHGQEHYYFARGAELVWLAGPPGLAPAMLGELVGAPADSLAR